MSLSFVISSNCISFRVVSLLRSSSGSVGFRFVSCRRVAFRFLSCRRFVCSLLQLRFASFCVDASWRQRKKQSKKKTTDPNSYQPLAGPMNRCCWGHVPIPLLTPRLGRAGLSAQYWPELGRGRPELGRDGAEHGPRPSWAVMGPSMGRDHALMIGSTCADCYRYNYALT